MQFDALLMVTRGLVRLASMCRIDVWAIRSPLTGSQIRRRLGIATSDELQRLFVLTFFSALCGDLHAVCTFLCGVLLHSLKPWPMESPICVALDVYSRNFDYESTPLYLASREGHVEAA